MATHRKASLKAQRTLSPNTGDDAGHLFANEFGAAGDVMDRDGHLLNLTLQNRSMNQHYSWRKLEQVWEAKLKSGIGIEDVRIRDTFRSGELRPFQRNAEWTEVATDGTRTREKSNLIFGNFDSTTRRNAPNPVD